MSAAAVVSCVQEDDAISVRTPPFPPPLPFTLFLPLGVSPVKCAQVTDPTSRRSFSPRSQRAVTCTGSFHVNASCTGLLSLMSHLLIRGFKVLLVPHK